MTFLYATGYSSVRGSSACWRNTFTEKSNDEKYENDDRNEHDSYDEIPVFFHRKK